MLPKLKSRWYKRPSLSTRDDDPRGEKARARDQQYLEWLATSRGWFRLYETCQRCYGDGRIYDPDAKRPTADTLPWPRAGNWRYWARKWDRARLAAGRPLYLDDADKIECPECGGKGRLPCSEEPDIARADQHVHEQRLWLQERAEAACDGIRHRLFRLGLRPVRLSDRPIYDEAFCNIVGWEPAYDETRWCADSKEPCVYLNTHDPPRWLKPAFKIVICPGRAPCARELDSLAEQAIAALASREQEDEDRALFA